MTEEELAQHDSKTLLQLLLSADARCDALTAERDEAQAENDNAWAALWDILACETPNANATVTRMAAIARAALKGETP